MFDRAILHLDLDAFFASVEVLQNAALRGKPVLIGGSSARGVVASCSYEARRYGIHAAMPMRQALRRCPEAVVVRGDGERYAYYSKLVTEVIASEAPLFEKASIDEFYLDLTGMDRHFGAWQWSLELLHKIERETGLPLSMGMASSKLVSKVGVRVRKPAARQVVPVGEEQSFLAPLPVRYLPSVGRKTQEQLYHMGVRRIATLAAIPEPLLKRAFGKHGTSMWKKANAIDTTPVVPYSEAKSISTERTFSVDTIDVAYVRQELQRMITKLAFELRERGQLTSCIAVKLRYTDFQTFTRQRQIPYTALDTVLLQYAYELFDQLFTRRQRIRLVGIRFSGLVAGSPQIRLFERTDREIRLLETLDRLRRRYGEGVVVFSSLSL